MESPSRPVRGVVRLAPHRLPCGLPFVPGVPVVTDQLLLLAVHADHQIAGVPVISCLLVGVAELGIPVGVLSAYDGLGVGLQAAAFLPEQTGDRVGGDPMALLGQYRRELPRDFVVQRSGDIGSPSSSGSSSSGPESVAFFRPPPGRRTRPNGAWPESSSATPRETVPPWTPAAAAKSLIPPCPAAALPPLRPADTDTRPDAATAPGTSPPGHPRSPSGLPVPEHRAPQPEATTRFPASP